MAGAPVGLTDPSARMVANRRWAHHLNGMPKRHPHADAVYRIVPHTETTFGVEVVIPDSLPATVTSFASEADAEVWIARHRQRVQESAQRRPHWTQRRRS